MKIICDAPGQTCNRLWSYVATISECVVKKKRMMVLFYDYTIEDFPNFRSCSFIYFPLYHKWYLERGNGWNNFKGLTWKATHNAKLDKIYFFFGFFKGWHTRRDIQYISQAKSDIIRIFTPKESIVLRVENLFSEMRKDADMIVGVHIRRGDYKTWNHGAFFYELSQYRDFMLRVKELFKDKRVTFFISSNEDLCDEQFEGCHCFYFKNDSSAVLDLYSLSLCDRIIGPFSTFSRWASFYGEKPLCFLESVDQKFTEDSFSIIVDYYHFANGMEINEW